MENFIRLSSEKVNGYPVVEFIHHQPELLPAEVLEQGYLVSDIPSGVDHVEKKNAVMVFDEARKTLFYQYVDRAPTQEEIVSDLQSALVSAQDTINLLLGV